MDKMLPHNEKAEIEVLGAILNNNDKLIKVLDILKADDFYNTKHQNIFLNIINLFAKGIPINMVSIAEQVGTNIESIGGFTYLTSLTDSGLNSTDVTYYSNIIKDKSLRRTLIKKSELVKQKAYDNENKFDDLVAELQDIEITDNKKTIINDSALFTETMNEIEKRANNDEKISGMKTGLSTLDDATNGFQKGNLIIIGGRPSMGKTAFALNLIDNLGNNGHKGALFELEMDKKSLGIRRLAYECMINGYKLSRGELNDKEWFKVTNAVNKKSQDNNIFTDVSTGIGLMDIKARCKTLKNTIGLDFIVIDHLGLLKLPKADRNDLALGIVTSGLKALSKELDIAVILLCQLNRKCEERFNKRPLLSDLRDSGNIEQDADLIMFLYRDEYYNKDTDAKNILECNIAKQRNGATGVMQFIYLSKFQKIAELEWKNI